MLDAYIYDGLRTPFGRHAGKLAGIRPDDLLAFGADGDEADGHAFRSEASLPDQRFWRSLRSTDANRLAT